MNYRQFFSQAPTADIARNLLGHELMYQGPQGLLAGWIVETEAYLGEQDTASHAYGRGKTAYSASLYGEPGTLYVYQIRSYICLDIVAQASGIPHGILIRALEPTQGVKAMTHNRGKTRFELSNGPGKLMQALGIRDRKLDGEAMDKAPLQVNLSCRREPIQIITGPRIGMRKGAPSSNWPLRFYVAGNPYVSHTRRRDANLKNYGWRDEQDGIKLSSHA